jgi:hypothetical protein
MTNNTVPPPVLEERVRAQRQQIHRTAEELRDTLRETMNVRRQAREHLLPAAGGVAFVALILGYSFAGMFTRR